MRTDATFVGLVKRVVGAKVLLEVSTDIPSANPVVEGRIYKLGQVGSFVRIPLGLLNLYGIVSMVGSADAAPPDADDMLVVRGQRWIEVHLVGEAHRGEKFSRGVSLFPTLDDEVHLVTEEDLGVIYVGAPGTAVSIGRYSASEGLAASLDLDKIVTRHFAVVGSTGSGKSNAVAALIKALAMGDYPNARVVIIDPHGEYSSAFEAMSRVFRIGEADSSLWVPYWALSFDELAWFLVGRKTASESLQDGALRDKMLAFKVRRSTGLRAGSVDGDVITGDSPIPFDLRQLWYDFDRVERSTYRDSARTVEALEEEGSSEKLRAARFTPPGAGSALPVKTDRSLAMAAYCNKMLMRLKDRRFDFLLSPGKYDGETKDLHDLLKDWIDHEHQITILDLAGVPFEVMDSVVGAVTRIIYEGMFWGRDLPGTGRQRPLLLVFEEAHAYLPRSEARFVQGFARASVQRILKEGRKYGIGAVIVSQRPSELDETIISQCGTFAALRLTNPNDQAQVKAVVPDTLAGLVDALPALRTGEALILGEAVPIPSRVRLSLVEPRPNSNDPEVSRRWREPRITNVDYAAAVSGWRRQKMAASGAAESAQEEGEDG